MSAKMTRINIIGLKGDNEGLEIKGLKIAYCYDGCIEVDEETLMKIEQDKALRKMVWVEGVDKEFYWETKKHEVDPNATLAEKYDALQKEYDTYRAKDGVQLKHLQSQVSELAGSKAEADEAKSQLSIATNQINALQAQLMTANKTIIDQQAEIDGLKAGKPAENKEPVKAGDAVKEVTKNESGKPGETKEKVKA